MSQSNAAAIKRRANIPTPNVPAQPASQQPQQGLPLPQVIAIIDTRLVKLETFMKTALESPKVTAQPTDLNNNKYDDVFSEFNQRFEFLAQELNDMKDIIMKLQSYTMEVNKTLLDERIHILSDCDNFSNAAVASNLTVEPEELPVDGQQVSTYLELATEANETQQNA